MFTATFSLLDKLAVITGASRGIGASIAAALARAGARVVLLGRDGAALSDVQKVIAESGHSASTATLDVTDVAQINLQFDRILQDFGPLDILINNAGVEQVSPSLAVTEAIWDRILDTNLKGAFFCAQAAARCMIRGGSIVNVCSLTSEVGVSTAAPYGASKSGLAGLTRSLAVEWAAKGIRVNGIGPGYFRTALTEAFYQDASWQQIMLPKIPLQRFGELDDLSGAAVFLSSDAASYITGQILYVDGGLLASL
jgi:NAD(P)-dependent dehydrogenase (short-subunit alcohol dehydrogenase family)